MEFKTTARPPTEEDTKQTADLGQKGKQRWMIHPSLKLGLIVYLRRLNGKKLAGAIAINGISDFSAGTKGPSYQSRKYRG